MYNIYALTEDKEGKTSAEDATKERERADLQFSKLNDSGEISREDCLARRKKNGRSREDF